MMRDKCLYGRGFRAHRIGGRDSCPYRSNITGLIATPRDPILISPLERGRKNSKLIIDFQDSFVPLTKGDYRGCILHRSSITGLLATPPLPRATRKYMPAGN